MNRSPWIIGGLVASLALSSVSEPISGFDAAGASAQQALEAKFDALISADEQKAWMEHLTARPHHLGSAFDRENAEYIAGLFRSWGYDTSIETYEVLFPTPKVRELEVIGERTLPAKLEEPTLAADSTSGQHDEQLPTYNAYSIDGDVTAEVVYVNYGVPKDYEELARRGISVKGKIALARYAGSWRGIKPKVAAEHGAIGTLIYSDPADDGYVQGDVYPEGPFRREDGVQRGSVMDMPLYPGDPQTPGRGSTKRAKRVKLKDVETLTKVPVMPISYGDALPILRGLSGPVAPDSFKGGLPVTYHLGPGPVKVHLKLAFNWDVVTLYDVIAKMKGSEYPDQWIMRGNHHDAWVNGAADPISGMVALMSEAKAMGEMARQGWKPKRTIVFAAWDGEEQGLLGSTEWVEDHASELREKAVAYVNTDGNGRGFLRVGGSHTLENMVNEIARDVTDPQTKVSVAERGRAALRLSRDKDAAREALARKNLRIYPLGSGSDYSPFLQHLGIASLNVGYGGENQGGSYHSIYDSFDHFTRFGDPGFAYGVALSQTTGRAVLRFANAEVVPFEFDGLLDNLQTYVDEVVKLADSMREETDVLNRQVEDGVYALALDPTKADKGPVKKGEVPHINFAPLLNAMESLKDAVATVRQVDRRALALSAQEREAVNRLLYTSERLMTLDKGLPRRPWYRHHIYAPGFYTGYGVKTLPGVREAIEERHWQEADEKIADTAGVIRTLAASIQKIGSTLPAGEKL
ncbi:MAG: M28 family metallopeptidase [Pseudomonadales bacterium]|nr:M28 family metallopeptidase [Pseudomonadales bacterium]